MLLILQRFSISLRVKAKTFTVANNIAPNHLVNLFPTALISVHSALSLWPPCYSCNTAGRQSSLRTFALAFLLAWYVLPPHLPTANFLPLLVRFVCHIRKVYPGYLFLETETAHLNLEAYFLFYFQRLTP